jgi:DNA-directed RNA polymerase subunit alpha
MDNHMYSNWRGLIKPRKVERDGKSGTNYGKFVVKPLERGFGTTIGNSLRRVLLSSLQGAAVTSVRIEGVLHEFAYLPGIVEDVTDIVLNIKGVLLRTSSPDIIRGRVSKRGEPGRPTIVRAGDFSFDGACEVLNPNHAICTLTHEGHFEADVTVQTGRGYVAAALNKNPEDPLGTIPVDAIFSPIKRVRYVVTNARVGNRTDYDKLTTEIYTDGSVTPEDALAYAAKILKEQLQIFINFAEEEEPEAADGGSEDQEYSEYLFKRVDELELSVRSQNCLQNAGIEFIWQLVERSEAEMLKTKNFGRKSLNEIKQILSQLNLNLGTKLSSTFPRHKAGV